MEIRGFDEMMLDLTKLEKEMPGKKNKLLSLQATKVRDQAKLLTPVDEGTLRGDWHFKKSNIDEYLVYNNVEYAPYVEFGHRITTKSKSLVGRILGRRTKTGFVKGSFMLKKSINRAELSFENDLREFLRKVTR